MRFIQFISSCLIICTNAFSFPPIFSKSVSKLPLYHLPMMPTSDNTHQIITVHDSKNITKMGSIVKLQKGVTRKMGGFLKLIRYRNILPTMCLSLAGGWMMNPSIIGLVYSPQFLTAMVDTALIMITSMIINDIFDVEVDRINHPTRPLVTGEIKRWEASIYAVGILGFTEFLNIRYITSNLQWIVHLAIIWITIYTPFLKRIVFVKNLSCASLVSFSTFFGGLASTRQHIPIHPNFPAFSITLSFLFFGSLYNELLLDIRDYEGDSENRIWTVPVVFGKRASWWVSGFLLFFNIFANTFAMTYVYDPSVGVIVPLLFSPMIYDSYIIGREGFSKVSICNALGKINITMIGLLLYMCVVCKYN